MTFAVDWALTANHLSFFLTKFQLVLTQTASLTRSLYIHWLFRMKFNINKLPQSLIVHSIGYLIKSNPSNQDSRTKLTWNKSMYMCVCLSPRSVRQTRRIYIYLLHDHYFRFRLFLSNTQDVITNDIFFLRVASSEKSTPN